LCIKRLTNEEVMASIRKQIMELFGKEPQLNVCAMTPTGTPMFVFTIDGKIASNTGIIIEGNGTSQLFKI